MLCWRNAERRDKTSFQPTASRCRLFLFHVHDTSMVCQQAGPLQCSTLHMSRRHAVMQTLRDLFVCHRFLLAWHQPSLCMQPVSESETDEDLPQQMNLSALPDRIGFIGAGQVVFAFLFKSMCMPSLLDTSSHHFGMWT